MHPPECDPFDPRMLAEFDALCRRFGPMPLPEFLELWREAGELVAVAEKAGMMGPMGK